MLWLALLGPVVGLALLLGMQRFEARLLASVPIRVRVRPRPARRTSAATQTAGSWALVPAPRTPQRS